MRRRLLSIAKNSALPRWGTRGDANKRILEVGAACALVRAAGVEPARPGTLEPKSSASAVPPRSRGGECRTGRRRARGTAGSAVPGTVVGLRAGAEAVADLAQKLDLFGDPGV